MKVSKKANIVDIEFVLGKVTEVFWWIFKSTKRVTINQGGTSSSKTYSTMQYLFFKAVTEPNIVITVVGQDIPNLRAGAIRDSFSILAGSTFLKKEVSKYNKSTLTYDFKNGSIIEFRSYEDSQDARSGKRDYSFFNEANGIAKDIYDEVADRTSQQIYLDFNPSQRCWIHDAFTNDDDAVFYISNFTHNAYVSPKIIKSLLKYRYTNPHRWRVFGLGLTGQAEGAVYTDWTTVDNYPIALERKKEAYFLDFGFTNSPTGFGRACISPRFPDRVYAQELIYKSQLTDKQLAAEFVRLKIPKEAPIIADSAAPQSIATLRDVYGYNVIAAKKAKDSINAGIIILQGYEIAVTKDSVNMITELENYIFKKYAGVFTNTPIDKFNHLLDPLRYYAIEYLVAFEPEPYVEKGVVKC